MCAVVGATLCLSAARASTLVGLDYVLGFDGPSLTLGDNFDAPTLQSPPWFVLSGSPLISIGSALQMHGNDGIIAATGFSGTADSTLIAQANLTDFTGDSALAVLLVGPNFNDVVGLLLTPNFAAAVNEGGVLGVLAQPAAPASQLVLTATTTGNLIATVDGAVVYAGPDAFGPLTQVIVSVVPEPATMAVFLALGALLRLRRR